ncbi:MAG: hypothetical protein KGN76_18525 [Acidobacteriota bacterium]|nr:hypothetical protein [Acidobacteriota bacterium]
MNHSETLAQMVVEAAVPGARMVYRSDQSRSVADFDLHLPTGVLVAAEVTAAIDRAERDISAAIEDLKKGGRAIRIGECKRDWLIHPDISANIKDIRRRIAKALAALERDRIFEFFGPTDAYSHSAVRVVYEDLHVYSGFVTHWKEPGFIRMAPVPSEGGLSGPNLLIAAAGRQCMKSDNRAKLGGAGTAERHLLVYIDPGYFLPWRSFWHFAPPPSRPTVPPEITDVCAFTESIRLSNHCAVWRASKREPWHDIGDVRLARSHGTGGE